MDDEGDKQSMESAVSARILLTMPATSRRESSSTVTAGRVKGVRECRVTANRTGRALLSCPRRGCLCRG